MSYTKQNFKDGSILTAAQMNHIEEGIVEAEKAGSSDTISTTAKNLIVTLFEGAANGNTTMQTQLDALKTEWGVSDGGDTSEPVPVFSLPKTEFTPENATVVDTGIKLFESAEGAKDYTIIISQRPHSTTDVSATDKYCLLHCMDETDPRPGLFIAGNGSRYGRLSVGWLPFGGAVLGNSI